MTCPACGNDDPRMIDIGKTYAVCEVCSKIWCPKSEQQLHPVSSNVQLNIPH